MKIFLNILKYAQISLSINDSHNTIQHYLSQLPSMMLRMCLKKKQKNKKQKNNRPKSQKRFYQTEKVKSIGKIIIIDKKDKKVLKYYNNIKTTLYNEYYYRMTKTN